MTDRESDVTYSELNAGDFDSILEVVLRESLPVPNRLDRLRPGVGVAGDCGADPVLQCQ